MRDDYHLQTQQKEHPHINRKIKPIAEHSKKNQNSRKKSFNSVFTPVPEDAALQLPEDSIDIASISEFFDENQLSEFEESLITSSGPTVSPSSSVTPGSSSSSTMNPSSSFTIAPGPSELTPLSSTLTSEKVQAFDASVTGGYRAAQSNAEGANSFEMELMVKHLRQSKVQVLKSSNVDLEYKKLLDALIDKVIEDFYSLPKQRDWFPEFVSRKVRAVLLSFVIWIIAVSAVFFFYSGVQSSYDRPPPT